MLYKRYTHTFTNFPKHSEALTYRTSENEVFGEGWLCTTSLFFPFLRLRAPRNHNDKAWNVLLLHSNKKSNVVIDNYETNAAVFTLHAIAQRNRARILNRQASSHFCASTSKFYSIAPYTYKQALGYIYLKDKQIIHVSHALK